MTTYQKKEKGFVIFVALFMVVMITAIGIFIITIALKEFRIANIQQDSLRAFSAADIGIECAFHHDIVGGGSMGRSAFPSIATTEENSLNILRGAGIVGLSTNSLYRKAGLGPFPASIDCFDGQNLTLNSVYDDSPPEPFIKTTIAPYLLPEGVCVEVQVYKITKINEDNEEEEYTRIESNGKKTSDCSSPGTRSIERALFLIWGDRN